MNTTNTLPNDARFLNIYKLYCTNIQDLLFNKTANFITLVCYIWTC